MAVIEGICNFSNLTQHDIFNGQDTGQFSMTITMTEDDASELAAQGVKIKDYQGPHPVHGVSTYLEAVKVLEEAELELGEAADF